MQLTMSFEPLLKQSMTGMMTVFLLLLSLSANAVLIAEKTPSDVYIQVQLLSQDVHALRNKNHILSPWPTVIPEQGRAPRHVFQKTLEILDKINRYRINIAHSGAITVPRFPGRDITPNEVYSVVIRLRQELALLVGENNQERLNNKRIFNNKNITPNEVYAALSEISIALDESLGIRGITPSEVYIRSEQVLQLAIFLRNSQHLSMDVKQPERPGGRLPNHALQYVNHLLMQINKAEKNLWMKPIEVPALPRRVIFPGDVYDAMGLALAELQRIQFRLGLERSFPIPAIAQSKTPDDVIQNVEFAIQLLPEFNFEEPLQQYDRNTLVKTPNHVYSLTEHILKELRQYRRIRGIKSNPGKAIPIRGIQPQHVYGKTLEIIEKINLIRQHQKMGAITEPHYPLRKITPTEVFNEALRVDEELNILYRQAGMDSQLWITATDVEEYNDKTPSDVFLNMQRISSLLDTILGTDAFTPYKLYREAQLISQEIENLAQHFDEQIIIDTEVDVQAKPSAHPEDVFNQVKKLLTLVLEVERRAGMFQVYDFSVSPADVITATEVFNLIRVVLSELTELKVFLGINETPSLYIVKKEQQVNLSDVIQLLRESQVSLEQILHKKHPADETQL